MSDNPSSILDLSFPRDETSEHVDFAEASNFSKDETKISTVANEPQDFSVNRCNDQQSIENKRNIPLVSATALKRKGPQIEPYIPPAPQPKVRRQIPPPPLITCISQPVPNVNKNLNVQLQLKIPTAQQGKFPQGMNIGSQQSQQQFNQMLVQQAGQNQHPNQLMPRINPGIIGQNPQRSTANFNPYSIAGVTPLFPRPSIARTSQPPNLLRPTAPGTLNTAPGHRLLVPTPRAPSRFVTNPHVSNGNAMVSKQNNHSIGVGANQQCGFMQGTSSSLTQSSAIPEEAMPRHNNPFMTPIRKQEPVKQTRVAFKNSPEFSLVHVQQPAGSSQTRPQMKTFSNFAQIVPRSHHVRMPQTSQMVGRSIPAHVTSSPQTQIQFRAPFNQPRPVFSSGQNMSRPQQVQLMRTASFQPMISNQQIAAITSQAKSIQDGTFTFVPKSSPSGLVRPANQVNFVNQAQSSKSLQGGFQVVATPVVQSMAPQLARPGVQNNRFSPHQNQRIPAPTVNVSPNHLTAKGNESITGPGSSQNRFFNPVVVSGVRPLAPKPKPVFGNQLNPQQQKFAASLSSSVYQTASSTSHTSGNQMIQSPPVLIPSSMVYSTTSISTPRFLNPQQRSPAPKVNVIQTKQGDNTYDGNNDAESALSEYHSTVSTHLTPGTPTNGSNFTARTPVAPPPPPPPLIRPTCKTIVNPAAQNPKVQKSQLSPAGVAKLADSLKRGSLPRDSSSGCWKEFNQKEILDAVRNATSSSSQGKRALPASVKETSDGEIRALHFPSINSDNNCSPKSEVTKMTCAFKSCDELLLKLDVENQIERLKLPVDFDWSRYSGECVSANEMAPMSCFATVRTIHSEELPEGVVIEVPSGESMDSWWVASVVYSNRNNILVRYAGLSDPLDDAWIDIQTTDIHSIGWCQKNNRKLEPPKNFPFQMLHLIHEADDKHAGKNGIFKPISSLQLKAEKDTLEDHKISPNTFEVEFNPEMLTRKVKLFLRNFLVGRVSVSEQAIEDRLFWPIEFRIPNEARFEFEYEPKKVWLVKVVTNHSGLLLLRFEGVPDSVKKHDFLLFFASEKLRPVGYAMKSYDTIMEPPNLLSEFVSGQEQVVKTYKSGWLKHEQIKVRMPNRFFNQSQSMDLSRNHHEGFSRKLLDLQEFENSKLEVIFTKCPHLICVATVTRVDNENTVTVTLDNCSSASVDESELSESFSLDSFNLRPALWSEQNGVDLTWPLNYNPTKINKNPNEDSQSKFVWHDYLMQKGKRCFPKNMLRSVKSDASTQNNNHMLPEKTTFKVGHKIEFINPYCPRYLSPGTIVKVAGRVLQVEIDGWFIDEEKEKPARVFLDAEGFSVFPAMWSKSVGSAHFLMPNQNGCPLNDDEKSSKISRIKFSDLKILKRIVTEDRKCFSEEPSEQQMKLHHSNYTNKFWCPVVYVNFKCCKDPIFSRYRLSCLSQKYGPGLTIYVLRTLLNSLIMCSVKPFQVLREIIGICSHYDSVMTSQAYIKAKFKTKNLHAFVKIPELFSDMEHFLQTVLRKFGCCENLFTIQFCPKRVCDDSECLANYHTLTAQELTDYKESDCLTNAYLNKSRVKVHQNKRKRKKKMLFSSQKRTNNTSNSNNVNSKLVSNSPKRGVNKPVNSKSIPINKIEEKSQSDSSVSGSRPVTPHSESPIDTTDFGKFITVEPKRGFVKLKKGASVTAIGTTNPPEREKSKRHKSVFSTVNMIAKSEIDMEDFAVHEIASTSTISKSGESLAKLSSGLETEFRPISPVDESSWEKTCSMQSHNSSSNSKEKEAAATSSNKVPAVKEARRAIQRNKNRTRPAPVSPQKQNGKIRKTQRQISSEGEKMSSELTLRKGKSSPRKRPQTMQQKSAAAKRCTRAANPLQKTDPLKWSTEELCLHLNTTECADFLPFIRRENIDGQSFLLLNFSNLVELCEVKKDLALKVCYQVAKLKKQYLHINGSKTDDSNSSGFGEV